MNRLKAVLLFVLLLFVFTLPGIAFAAPLELNPEIMKANLSYEQPMITQQAPDGDKLVFGSEFVLEKGETLEGDLVVFGGTADLETGSIVEGDVVIFGSKLEIEGKIEGQVVVVGGSIDIHDTAVIEGDLSIVSGSINKEDGAVIKGSILEDVQPFIPFSVFEDFQIHPSNGQSPIIITGDFHSRWNEIWMNPIWDFV